MSRKKNADATRTRTESRKFKHGDPGSTGGLGAAVDPGSSVDFRGWGGLTGPSIHFLAASLTIGANLVVNLWEYSTIARNHTLIESVMSDVRRIRSERGLPA